MENSSGVLSQVSRLFSRKGYNIESLAVGTTDDPAESRITIEVMGDSAMMEQLMNQLRKLFPVHSVQELLPERSIRRELVMFKVKAETSDVRNEIIQIANIFRSSIIDVSVKSLTLALIGDESKAAAMEDLLDGWPGTLILITHDLGVVAQIAQNVMVMYAGQAVEYADVRSVFKDPLHPYTVGLLKSLPVLGEEKDSLYSIKGNIPSPKDYPEGCRFSPRCEKACQRCHKEPPPLFDLPDGRRVRCWNYEGGKTDV